MHIHPTFFFTQFRMVYELSEIQLLCLHGPQTYSTDLVFIYNVDILLIIGVFAFPNNVLTYLS